MRLETVLFSPIPTLAIWWLTTMQSFRNVILGTGFGGITDLKIGPDGLLYVLSFLWGRFSLSRISPHLW